MFQGNLVKSQNSRTSKRFSWIQSRTMLVSPLVGIVQVLQLNHVEGQGDHVDSRWHSSIKISHVNIVKGIVPLRSNMASLVFVSCLAMETCFLHFMPVSLDAWSRPFYPCHICISFIIFPFHYNFGNSRLKSDSGARHLAQQTSYTWTWMKLNKFLKKPHFALC